MLITIEIFTHLTYKLLMKNLLKDLEPAGEQTTLFSQAGSRNYANHTHRLENDLEKKMTATSGQRCLEQYERFSRPTLWGRMFSDLLIGMEGWYSTKCRLTWKLKGTKYNRLYFQLVPSTLPTEGIGFGLLLKTPSAMDSYSENLSKKEQKFGNSGTLAQEVQSGFIYQRGMLPTPTAMDSSNATANMKSTQVKEGSMHSVTLTRAMVTGMLPTPSAFDHKLGVKKETYEKRKQRHLEKGVNLQYPLKQMAADITNQNGKVSQLNPPFVLEMMGFPPDWTELPFLNGETKA
jgi:hypothetical protein